MLKKPSLSKKKTLARRLTLGKTLLDFEIEKAYEKIVRDKIEEAYNKTLVELLRNIGITLKNAKNTSTN